MSWCDVSLAVVSMLHQLTVGCFAGWVVRKGNMDLRERVLHAVEARNSVNEPI